MTGMTDMTGVSNLLHDTGKMYMVIKNWRKYIATEKNPSYPSYPLFL